MRKTALSTAGIAMAAALLVATSQSEPQPWVIAEGELAFPEAPMLEAGGVVVVTWEISVTTPEEWRVTREVQALTIEGSGPFDDTVELALTDCEGGEVQDLVGWVPVGTFDAELTDWVDQACRLRLGCTATACLRAQLDGVGPVEITPSLTVAQYYSPSDEERQEGEPPTLEVDAEVVLLGSE